MKHEHIEHLWRRCLEDLGISEASRLCQQRNGGVTERRMGQRTYAFAGRVYKISLREIEPTGSMPWGDTKREFELISMCRDLPAIPEAIEFIETNEYQAAVYRWVDAVSMIDPSIGIWKSCIATARLAPTLLRLSRRGIAHNDVMPNNVLISPRGQIYLIDFDRATVCSRTEAIVRNFLKYREQCDPVLFFGSLAKLVRVQLGARMPDSMRRIYQYATRGCRRRH